MTTFKEDTGSEQGCRERLAAADAELDAVNERLEALLRDRRPDLFDRHGLLREQAVTELLIERAGKSSLTKADVIQEKPQTEAAPRSARA